MQFLYINAFKITSILINLLYHFILSFCPFHHMPALFLPFYPSTSSLPCSYMPPFCICCKFNFLTIPRTLKKFCLLGWKLKHVFNSCILPRPFCIFFISSCGQECLSVFFNCCLYYFLEGTEKICFNYQTRLTKWMAGHLFLHLRAGGFHHFFKPCLPKIIRASSKKNLLVG